MEHLFYLDNNQKFYYSDFINQLNKRTIFYQEYFAENFFDSLVNTVSGIILNKKIILVDYLFSQGKNLNGQTVNININSFQQLLDYIKKSTSEVGIYSSGSEGPPKLIFQSIARLLLSVRIDNAYKQTRWGFTYHPAHSAGIQFILQVLCNHATIINLRDLKRDKLVSFLLNSNLDYISATPTFYRLLAPFDFQLKSVKNVTLNGEKSTQKLIDEVKTIFPNASVRNIYGSTEAGPLMSSDSEVFTVPVRLLDKIKIEEDELFLHQSIVSKSVQINEWYPSGDIVEEVEKEPLKIRFISRKSRIINVGGHNVNPQYIEELLMKIPGIIDVRVYGRENKITSHLIVAEIHKEIGVEVTEKQIIDYLKDHLQSYKIPRIIRFVDSIEVGRTGKKVL